MKQTIFLLMLVMLTSCEREIGDLTEKESPRLVVNALLTAGNTSKALCVSETGLVTSWKVADANVAISVNGAVTFTADKHTDRLVVPTDDIHPGDIVSVTATKGSHTASATVEVPQPIIITGLDTMTIMAKEYDWSVQATPHTRYKVHLRLPNDVKSGEMRYFRVEVEKNLYEGVSASGYGDVITDVHYELSSDHITFHNSQDAALTENENHIFSEDSPISVDWLEGDENKYHIFRSAYFKDGEYTLSLDLPYAGKTWLGWYQDVTIRVYAISHIEYNYLQALTALVNGDIGSITEGEATMPTNITGGAGIFCVESVSECHFHESHIKYY